MSRGRRRQLKRLKRRINYFKSVRRMVEKMSVRIMIEEERGVTFSEALAREVAELKGIDRTLVSCGKGM